MREKGMINAAPVEIERRHYTCNYHLNHSQRDSVDGVRVYGDVYTDSSARCANQLVENTDEEAELKTKGNQSWQYMPIIPYLKNLKQEDCHEFKAI